MATAATTAAETISVDQHQTASENIAPPAATEVTPPEVLESGLKVAEISPWDGLPTYKCQVNRLHLI